MSEARGANRQSGASPAARIPAAADDIRVRGAADAEELAVLLAALSARTTEAAREPDGYDRWRRVRLAALRRTSGER